MKDEEILNMVSDNIRLLRIKNRITQDKLAEMVDISGKYLNMIENRKANPTILIVVKICQKLNCELNDIMQEM